ncbi:hypothetical protein DH2020_010464 [Rehmannia glutinosa]|uniref:Uncharacterized protein n=1 Tax=Rehmannia glutinosa TaxID=99300 RepID=A0ABR0XAR8_REHGL
MMLEKEAKKEAFRKYLESSGVLDALTKGYIHSSVPCLTYQLYILSSVSLCLRRGNVYALTVVLVALYEQNDKPSSAIEFIQQKLGGPSLAEYEKLQAEAADLQMQYNELLAVHQEKCREYEELKNTHIQASTKETPKEEAPTEGL